MSNVCSVPRRIRPNGIDQTGAALDAGLGRLRGRGGAHLPQLWTPWKLELADGGSGKWEILSDRSHFTDDARAERRLCGALRGGFATRPSRRLRRHARGALGVVDAGFQNCPNDGPDFTDVMTSSVPVRSPATRGVPSAFRPLGARMLAAETG